MAETYILQLYLCNISANDLHLIYVNDLHWELYQIISKLKNGRIGNCRLQGLTFKKSG